VPGGISADLNIVHLGRLFPKTQTEDGTLKQRVEELETLLADKDTEIQKKVNAMVAARNTLDAALGK